MAGEVSPSLSHYETISIKLYGEDSVEVWRLFVRSGGAPFLACHSLSCSRVGESPPESWRLQSWIRWSDGTEAGAHRASKSERCGSCVSTRATTNHVGSDHSITVEYGMMAEALRFTGPAAPRWMQADGRDSLGRG